MHAHYSTIFGKTSYQPQNPLKNNKKCTHEGIFVIRLAEKW